MKNIIIITICFVLGCLTSNAYAQNGKKLKKSDDSRMIPHKRVSVEPGKSNVKNTGLEVKSVKSKKSLSTTSRKSNVAANSSTKTLKKPTPATRVSVVREKKSINNKINPALSNIDNIFNLLEEKENVTKYGNSTLVKSEDYKILNNNIIELKINFNNYVVKKGIKNCSEKEQNFYLSSLKEDGKEEEYKKNIRLIKSSK